MNWSSMDLLQAVSDDSGRVTGRVRGSAFTSLPPSDNRSNPTANEIHTFIVMPQHEGRLWSIDFPWTVFLQITDIILSLSN